MLIAISCKPNLNVVTCVPGKVVPNSRTPARTQGKFLEVVFLREVRGKRDGVAAWRTAGTAHRKPADLSGGRQVSFQESGRQIPHGYIVETVAGLVARQHRGHVHLDREQV